MRRFLLAILMLLAVTGSAAATDYIKTNNNAWTVVSGWDPAGVPPALGAPDATIAFSNAIQFRNTNNLTPANTGFFLNKFRVQRISTITSSYYSSNGNFLAFTNNGDIVPSITNSVPDPFSFQTPIALYTNFFISGMGGAVTLSSNITEEGQSCMITITNGGTVNRETTLTGSNSFSGGIIGQGGTERTARVHHHIVCDRASGTQIDKRSAVDRESSRAEHVHG